MEDPNKNINNNPNDQYEFFNTKDDHGFNDNIYDTQAGKTAAKLRIIVFVVVGVITFIAIVFMFSGMLVKYEDGANNIPSNAMSESLMDGKNRIFNAMNSFTSK